MKWYEDYATILSLFEKGHSLIDETMFIFQSDPEEEEHYIGYLPQYEKPYWAGLCDVPGGCEFSSATELFEARIYNGMSIRERWDDLILELIGGMDPDYVDPSWYI